MVEARGLATPRPLGKAERGPLPALAGARPRAARAELHSWVVLLVARCELVEMLHNQQLRARGEVLLADDRIVVDHFQSVSFPTFCALHFHNGRLIAGYRLARMSWPERILRLAGCTVLPAVMLWRTLRIAYANRRLRGIAARTSPLMAGLLCCHSAGELVGYLFGAGRSARFRHIG